MSFKLVRFVLITGAMTGGSRNGRGPAQGGAAPCRLLHATAARGGP